MTNYSYLSSPLSSQLQYKTIVDVLNEKTEETPDKEILIYRFPEGRRKILTYRQLQKRSVKLANFLVSNGISVGDNVAIIGPNSLEWVVGEFAIFMSGAVAVHMQKTSEVFSETLKLLQRTKCKAALIDPDSDTSYLTSLQAYIESKEQLEQRKDNVLFFLIRNPERVPLLPRLEDIISTNDDTEGKTISLPRINPESSAIIFTTSGSTGVPKLAEFTHFAFTNAPYASYIGSGSDQFGILYNDRPFTWIGGTPLFSIMIGNPRVFTDTTLNLEKDNIMSVWDILIAEQCTNAGFLPYALTDLIQKKQEISEHGYKLYSIGTGGQMIGSHLTEVINAFCDKMFLGYGSTEAGMITWNELTPEASEGDVGKLIPGYEVKIVGDTNAPLEKGVVGEILVRSPFMMKCYRDSPDLNQASFTDGGWFRTGDIGIVTENDTLCVKGKERDVIKRGGMKILSSEVEGIIAKIKGVQEAVVFAVPDDRLLEDVCACFVRETSASTTKNEIRKVCHETLGDNILGKSPSFYVEFDDFPRLAAGKPDKVLIRERALNILKKDW